MKKLLTLSLILLCTEAIYAQQPDYKKINDIFYKEANADTKAELKVIFNGRILEDVIRNPTAQARDTIKKYADALDNMHLSGPYTANQLSDRLHNANIDIDATLKVTALRAANHRLPQAERLSAFQILFGLNSLMHHPLKVSHLRPWDEFIKNDIFLPWKNPHRDGASLTAYQLYDAYKLGVRIAQSEGNKQLTDYFKSKEDETISPGL